VDSREQNPYTFVNLHDNVRNGRSARLIVPTVRCALKSGDYSIFGYVDVVTIERKSKQDLWQSISQNRSNFVERLERMESFEFACIMVESSWDNLLVPPPYTEYKPKSLSRTLMAWIRRYKTKWIMAPSREFAESMTFRLLQGFWNDKQEDKKC
jgi:ERCC4-type nuclease